jgi:hypothetical protein
LNNQNNNQNYFFMPVRTPKNSNKVEPSSFDLAVIEVVNHIYQNAPRLNIELREVPDQKDILNSIGINPQHWPQMVNHNRHVSKKPLKQQEIVTQLRKLYWVNPDYIWKYPHEKSIFIIDGILSAAEDGIDYKKIPSSAKLLRKELLAAFSKIDGFENTIQELTIENRSLKEDIANLKLLVKQLKSDGKPDKKKV